MGKYEVISSKSKKVKRVLVLAVSFLLIIISSGIGIYYFLSLEEESKLISDSLLKKDTNIDDDTNTNNESLSNTDDDLSINKFTSIGDVVNNYEKTTSIAKKLMVDIKGQVKNPGTYEVDLGTRVIDVINIAGGLTAISDTSLINLSKKVFDEMVIIVYSKDEVLNMNNNKQDIKNEVENNASIEDSNSSVNNIININTASVNELTTLSGIGEAKAQDIINYRESNGGFKTIDEIMNVTGIGESLFAKIKENITV